MVLKGVGRAEGTFSKLRMSDLAAFLKRGPCGGLNVVSVAASMACAISWMIVHRRCLSDWKASGNIAM